MARARAALCVVLAALALAVAGERCVFLLVVHDTPSLSVLE
jgi:hypothetical protein